MTDVTKSRPLSPHLQIYKPIPTMVMSIVHRITGGALYFGTILVAWWLIAAASGPAYYDWVSAVFGSLLGRLVLFGYTWALVHHLFGGIRHFLWDMGHAYEKNLATKMAIANAIGSVVVTLLIWIVGYAVR
ncbi:MULTISPECIES: succinate dehydrogenase, cytochrome b556 subunit [unclassified Rhizobium]|uniref:succinate dehydrogenase, cytochrome b556 subunit n=1 Tax=unclassified Rhizobium TaxID=2613769 RepID=UPI0006FFEBE3|nr:MULTISPECIES: succinate dehydrogenase, cytochrome b556 subunit [unclassified Rhizobium]KQV35607.1 succinate dehydrogenase [Rhizobium sp. Root1212]KRD25713.1 succinate dehydrogenase [Rhizobium sp. Root268]